MKPRHVAIIMDGNGRWATKRGLSRTEGHKEGLNTAKKIVKFASDLNIDFISLYVFSTENWKRTESEVGFLMTLIEKHLQAEFEFYKANNIRVLHIGNLSGLPERIQNSIKKVQEDTRDFEGTSVVLAINYGGKDEILRAIEKWSKTNESLNEESFSKHLDTACIPPVDLLIRTGGEKRLSNFLLWQASYAELFFTETLWPDWSTEDFKKAIEEFENRDRRFGNIK